MESLDLVNPSLYKYKKRNFLVKDKMRPKDLDELLHAEIRPTDVFIATYPKSGLTEALLDQLSGGHRAPVLGLTAAIGLQAFIICYNPFRDRPDPRMLGSHLPFEMLPLDIKAKQVKVVYVWRNPKDIAVSAYYFAHSWVLLETPKSFEDFFQQFLDGDVYMGSWFDHVKEYYAQRDQLNIHFVQYENLLKDLRGEVVRLCAFLEEDLTDEVIDRIIDVSTFKSMKTNPKANFKDLIEKGRYNGKTMRKGIAGDWKNLFTVSQNERFDRVYKEKMSNVPITCTWEISQ